MFFLLAAVVIALFDFVVKSVIVEIPAQYFPKKIWKDHVEIRRVYNKGIATGKLEEYPEHVKRLTTLLLMVTLLFELPFLLSKKRSKIQKLGMSMILGGALSNVIDRHLRGHVVDYIGFPAKNPKGRVKYLTRLTFNIADFCIFIGSVLIFFQKRIGQKEGPTNKIRRAL